MAQLVMNWENDGRENREVILPSGVEIKTFNELGGALEAWLDIVRYMGQTEGKTGDREYYDNVMTSCDNYNEDMCYFLTVDAQPAATVTVICNYSEKKGYVHMVCCKPQFRGRGFGHILNDVAVNALKREGMKTAHLTTDDWRIPAIKTYLKSGFKPDLDSEDDFKERWDKIYSIINA